MEFLLFIGVVYVLDVVYNQLRKNTTDTSAKMPPKSDVSSYARPKDFGYVSPKKVEETIVNNYYTQNNVYVQQNNYYEKPSQELSDHTAKIWKRLGYSIKHGETYSYKFYGNEIFKPNQVERIGSNHVKYSESGLARKLLNDTGSKKHAKDILVNQYGYSQASAKSLVGYNGY